MADCWVVLLAVVVVVVIVVVFAAAAVVVPDLSPRPPTFITKPGAPRRTEGIVDFAFGVAMGFLMSGALEFGVKSVAFWVPIGPDDDGIGAFLEPICCCCCCGCCCGLSSVCGASFFFAGVVVVVGFNLDDLVIVVVL